MTPADPTSSAGEVLDVFRDQCRWMVEGRAALLDGILADSFTAQHITGYVSPKAEWVDQIRSGDFVYHSIRDSAPHQRTDREGRTVTVGRKILRTIAVMTAVGGFVVDWNRTHLFNPSWPPHARFHDAMTITLGTFLGGSALYFLRDGAGRRDVAIGALPAFFWTSMGTAFTFPGTAGMEAGFPQYVPRVRGVWINERYPSAVMTAAAAGAYALERQTESLAACRAHTSADRNRS